MKDIHTPASYDTLMQTRQMGLDRSYTERDSKLYAYSIGMGRDPLDPRQLDFVFEQPGLKVLPTQACVIARANLLHNVGLDRTKVLHGEQRIRLDRPLPPGADLKADVEVVNVCDKGEGKGALVYYETRIALAKTDERLCTLTSTIFARGDGGCGGPSEPGPAPHVLPDRPPDITTSYTTRTDLALLYRLNGDLNPLHADPRLARRAGFHAPILHGLATYGIACREIVEQVCDFDPGRLRELDARFTSPVYPGETITTEIWLDGEDISFRCRIAERDKVALDNGRCRLAPN